MRIPMNETERIIEVIRSSNLSEDTLIEVSKTLEAIWHIDDDLDAYDIAEIIEEHILFEGFRIKMKCGDVHTIQTDQPEVEYIVFNGEQIYPIEATPEPDSEPKPESHLSNEERTANMFTETLSGEWKFHCNTRYKSISEWRNGLNKKLMDIDPLAVDAVISPIAWDRYGNRLHGYYGLYYKVAELQGLGALFG